MKTALLVFVLSAATALQAQPHPRSIAPPLPEMAPRLYRASFDEVYQAVGTNLPDTVTTAYGTLVSSWSGYALERSGSAVMPFVVPALDSAGRTNFACHTGAIRFWLTPYWSSASLTNGTGPGVNARLLELVVLSGQQVAVAWSLEVNADGSVVSLMASGKAGPEELLSAEIAWPADEARLITLNYGPAGTSLFLDGELAGQGAGTLAIPPSVTGLVIGSTLAGTDTAGGYVDEVCAFARPLSASELSFYWHGTADNAALGPVTEEEWAARQERLEAWAKLKAAEESGGGGPQMRLIVGGTSECFTNVPLFITNIFSIFVTNQAWTVRFDIQGGTNGLLYDVFTTTNFSGNSITNAQWTWLERGPTCSTYEYTNQPDAQTFYILGTPQDSDGDGLTDAFEQLVSKTLVSTNDTDGDSLPDAWEVANGLNPLVNDASEDPDGDGLTNYQEYLAGSNPQSGTMIVAWGGNASGQCNVPTNLLDVVAVAGGESYSLALKQNGKVVAWGGNALGETTVPSALTNVTAIAANGYFACSTPTGFGLALTNGRIAQWGTMLGNSPSLTDVAAVAPGAFHGLALRSNGTVVAWGNTNQWAARVPANLTGVKAIATGWHHGVGLLNNGTVAAWGLHSPQIGYTMTNVPAGLSNVAAISAYGLHTVALRSNGTVVAWGYNQSGQTNVPAGLSNVIAVAAGAGPNVALKNDGTLATWGAFATAPANLDQVTAIAAGRDHCLAVRTGKLTPVILQSPQNLRQTNGGSVTFSVTVASLATPSYQWQSNHVILTGETSSVLTLNNVQTNYTGASYSVEVCNGAGCVESAAGSLTVVIPGPPVIQSVTPALGFYWMPGIFNLSVEATAAGGEFVPIHYQWKRNGIAITNVGATMPSYLLGLTPTAEFQGDYTVAVTNALGTTNVGPWRIGVMSAGGLAAWSTSGAETNMAPAAATNLIGLAAGATHSLGVREDGGVVGWGANDFGKTNVPPSVTNAVAVAAGNNHSLALRIDGTVIGWGLNASNQTDVPDGLTNVAAIAAGGNQSMALLSNGTVTNWGNTFGVIPAGLTSVVAIAAGTNFCLALRSNGSVAAWGGNTSATNVPAAASNVVAIAAGSTHALALRQDGHVVAWGSQTNVPTDLTNTLAIAAGHAHSAALRNDSVSVVTWSDNGSGQTKLTANLPPIKLIAAGGDRTLASAFSQLVQYPVDVIKDLLLIYNTNSPDSRFIKDYYLAHRPMVSGANALGIACSTNEIITPGTFTNQILQPYLDWLNQNPTKRPQYLIAFLDIPSRVHETTNVYDSVFYQLHTKTPGTRPFVMTINMDGTNDCRAYIDKLRFFGTNYSPGKLIISASAGGQYNNTNYVVDNVRHDDYLGYAENMRAATNGLRAAGVPVSSIAYLEDVESCLGRDPGNNNYCTGGYTAKLHITNAVNLAGYVSWGFHSTLGILGSPPLAFSTNGAVVWTESSSWYVIETFESGNGQRNTDFGGFFHWFSPNAFGGSNHANTPVGAVTQVDEPGLDNVNNPYTYLNFWANGKSFGLAAWNSRETERFQAVGDPLVRR